MTDAEQKTRAEEKKKREELLLFLLLLLSQLKQPMDAVTLPINAKDRMLFDHRRAAALGRALASGTQLYDTNPILTDRDEAIAARRFDNDLAHLRQFAEDITRGRYTKPVDGQEDGAGVSGSAAGHVGAGGDLLDQAAMGRRMKLYADSVATTATMAFVFNSPPEAEFDWVLDHPETGHCTMCPELAANGPYTADTLPCVPGDWTTPCGINCACIILRSDGVKGFDPWT